MRLKAVIYRALKHSIDSKGPINYHNAMGVAAEVTCVVENEIRKAEGTDTPKKPIEAK